MSNNFTHVWSDTHFWHRNIILFCERPFADVEEMNETLIENFNSVVPHDGHTLWVGDCFFCNVSNAADIMQRLNGRHTLVRGNHDPSVSKCLRMTFQEVVDHLWLNIGEHRVLAVHKPSAAAWPSTLTEEYDATPGYVMHGHTHEPTMGSGRYIHVGVDALGFKPATIDAIKEEIEHRIAVDNTV